MLKNQGEQFDWITKTLIYHGCHPSETCQLRVSDIKRGALPCIYFSDRGESQHLKNALSNRLAPLYKKILDLGFLDYVEQRKRFGSIPLFDVTPREDDMDWSKDYRDAFGSVLDACRFKTGQRPTAYSRLHINFSQTMR